MENNKKRSPYVRAKHKIVKDMVEITLTPEMLKSKPLVSLENFTKMNTPKSMPNIKFDIVNDLEKIARQCIDKSNFKSSDSHWNYDISHSEWFDMANGNTPWKLIHEGKLSLPSIEKFHKSLYNTTPAAQSKKTQDWYNNMQFKNLMGEVKNPHNVELDIFRKYLNENRFATDPLTNKTLEYINSTAIVVFDIWAFVIMELDTTKSEVKFKMLPTISSILPGGSKTVGNAFPDVKISVMTKRNKRIN